MQQPRKPSLAIACMLGGLALIVLARLPQFLSGNLLPDGDESVLGLMALHMAEGRAFPLFFYGQQYGFCLPETLLAAGAFILFGVSTTALKAAMLALWAIGWFFTVASLRRLAGWRAACIAGVLLAVCPAWAVWALKARGGYLTAFALSGLALWLISREIAASPGRSSMVEARDVEPKPDSARPRRSRDLIPAFSLGLVCGLIYFAQPLWLAALAPLVVWYLLRLSQHWLRVAAVVFGVIIAAAVLLPFAQANEAAWSPAPFADPQPLGTLLQLPALLLILFTGGFYHFSGYSVGNLTDLAAVIWLIAAAGAAIAAFSTLRRDSRPSAGSKSTIADFMATWHVIGALCVILPALLITPDQLALRYLLPVMAPLIIAIALALDRLLRLPSDNGAEQPSPAASDRSRRAIAWTILIALAGAGVAAHIQHAGPSPPGFGLDDGSAEWPALVGFVQALEQRNIRHVYSVDPLFQWNVIFASREHVLVRWVRPTDRLPAYPRAVDEALWSGAPVGLVGTTRDLPALQALLDQQHEAAPPEILVYADRYFLLPDPSPPLLESLGFTLNPPATTHSRQQ